MPKNVLFLLKNRKNRLTLPPDPLASGGFAGGIVELKQNYNWSRKISYS